MFTNISLKKVPKCERNRKDRIRKEKSNHCLLYLKFQLAKGISCSRCRTKSLYVFATTFGKKIFKNTSRDIKQGPSALPKRVDND